MTAPPTSQTNPLPPVPNVSDLLEGKPGLISHSWMQWLTQLREKINTLNVNLVTWSSTPVNTGITAGTYGDDSHTLSLDVDATGRLVSVTVFPLNTSGGLLPMVTGEVSASQPVFVYLEDGSLLYTQVQ